MLQNSGFNDLREWKKGRGPHRKAALALSGMMAAGLIVSSYSNSLEAQEMVPVCGLEEHVHSEACYSYPETSQLICSEVDPYLQNILLNDLSLGQQVFYYPQVLSLLKL